MGKNKTIYLPDELEEYAEKHLNSFKDFVKEKIQEEMESSIPYCQKNVNFYNGKLDYWNKRLNKAKNDEEKKQDAYVKLVKETSGRSGKELDNYLTGKTGKRLLKQTGLTADSFREKLEDED